MAAKQTKKKKKSSSNGQGSGAFQQFFVWHGEKIVVVIVAAAALWIALQGLGYQTLSWQPNELEQASTAAEQAIRESTRTAADEELKIFDYTAYAEQIKEPIPTAPYRNTSAWNPTIFGSSPPTGAPTQSE